MTVAGPARGSNQAQGGVIQRSASEEDDEPWDERNRKAAAPAPASPISRSRTMQKPILNLRNKFRGPLSENEAAPEDETLNDGELPALSLSTSSNLLNQNSLRGKRKQQHPATVSPPASPTSASNGRLVDGQLVRGQMTTTRPLSPPSSKGLPGRAEDSPATTKNKQRQFWDQLDPVSPDEHHTTRTSQNKDAADTADDEGEADHMAYNNSGRHSPIHSDNGSEMDSPPRNRTTRRQRLRKRNELSLTRTESEGSYEAGDGEEVLSVPEEEYEGNLCDFTFNKLGDICTSQICGVDGNKAIQTTPPRRKLALSSRHTATLRSDSVEEHTAIEVEYVENEARQADERSDTGSSSTGANSSAWSPGRKNAYLAAMAKKAKEEFAKKGKELSSRALNRRRGKSGTGENNTSNDKSIASGGVDEATADDNDVYSGFSAAEKRNFLRLISSGLTPTESSQRIHEERKIKQMKNNETNENGTGKKNRFKFWKKNTKNSNISVETEERQQHHQQQTKPHLGMRQKGEDPPGSNYQDDMFSGAEEEEEKKDADVVSDNDNSKKTENVKTTNAISTAPKSPMHNNPAYLMKEEYEAVPMAQLQEYSIDMGHIVEKTKTTQMQVQNNTPEKQNNPDVNENKEKLENNNDTGFGLPKSGINYYDAERRDHSDDSDGDANTAPLSPLSPSSPTSKSKVKIPKLLPPGSKTKGFAKLDSIPKMQHQLFNIDQTPFKEQKTPAKETTSGHDHFKESSTFKESNPSNEQTPSKEDTLNAYSVPFTEQSPFEEQAPLKEETQSTDGDMVSSQKQNLTKIMSSQDEIDEILGQRETMQQSSDGERENSDNEEQHQNDHSSNDKSLEKFTLAEESMPDIDAVVMTAPSSESSGLNSEAAESLDKIEKSLLRPLGKSNPEVITQMQTPKADREMNIVTPNQDQRIAANQDMVIDYADKTEVITPLALNERPHVVSPETGSSAKQISKELSHEDLQRFEEDAIDVEIESYIESTEPYSSTYSVQDSQLSSIAAGQHDQTSVMSGMMTNGGGSVFTQGSSMTQSTTRSRRPGAAKDRLKKARQAQHAASTKKGWKNTIEAAAASNNRVWKPQSGWVDYSESMNDDVNSSMEDHSQDKLHISLDSITRNKEKDMENSKPVHQESTTEKITVPFPNEWQKERDDMITARQAKENYQNRDEFVSVDPTVTEMQNNINVMDIRDHTNTRLQGKGLDQAGMGVIIEETQSEAQDSVVSAGELASSLRRRRKHPAPGQTRNLASSKAPKASGWEETMRAVSANMVKDGHVWHPQEGWIRVDGKAVMFNGKQEMEGADMNEHKYLSNNPSGIGAGEGVEFSEENAEETPRSRDSNVKGRAENVEMKTGTRREQNSQQHLMPTIMSSETSAGDSEDSVASNSVLSEKYMRLGSASYDQNKNSRFPNPSTTASDFDNEQEEMPMLSSAVDFDSPVDSYMPRVNVVKVKVDEEDYDLFPNSSKPNSPDGSARSSKSSRENQFISGEALPAFSGKSLMIRPVHVGEADDIRTEDDTNENLNIQEGLVWEGVVFQADSFTQDSLKDSNSQILAGSNAGRSSISTHSKGSKGSRSVPRLNRSKKDTSPIRNRNDPEPSVITDRDRRFSDTMNDETGSGPSNPADIERHMLKTPMQKYASRNKKEAEQESPETPGTPNSVKLRALQWEEWESRQPKASPDRSLSPRVIEKGTNRVDGYAPTGEKSAEKEYEGEKVNKLELPQLQGASASAEWKSFLGKKVRDEREAAARQKERKTQRQNVSQQHLHVGYSAPDYGRRGQSSGGHKVVKFAHNESMDSVFDFGSEANSEFPQGQEATGNQQQPGQRSDNHEKFNITDSPPRNSIRDQIEEFPDISPIQKMEEVMSDDGNQEQKGFFKRLAECTGPILPGGKSPDGMPLAHLAFLRSNPQTGTGAGTGAGSRNPISKFPPYLCGRPDVIAEEDEDAEDEVIEGDSKKAVQHIKIAELVNSPKQVSLKIDGTSTPTVNETSTPASQPRPSPPETSQRRSSPPKSSGKSQMTGTSSVISEDFGAKTAYLEAIAMRTAVSKPRRSKRDRSTASTVSSTSSHTNSDRWKALLERKSAAGISPSKSRAGSSSEVSKAAERYAAEKVEEMMAKMASRSKSTPRSWKSREANGRVIDRMLHESGTRGGTLPRQQLDYGHPSSVAKNASLDAAEDLAAARVEAMMAAMSSSQVDEGEI